MKSSETFHITPNMLLMDEIMGKAPLKDLAQIQLVLPHIPSKALHKLQVILPMRYNLVHAQTQPNYSRKGITKTCWN